MLRIDNLTCRIGTRLLFDSANAIIGVRHRVGLVGRNGAGKTTLLRLMAGELEPDGGRVERPPRWRVGITHQEPPVGSTSLAETVLSADSELARLSKEAQTADEPHRIAEIHTRLRDREAHRAEARAARILAGLGFDAAAQRRPCDEFSGSWRMRVALAALLFTEPDLLLLDEPTNHLDLEAALWLEDYLRSYPGTLLLVSHDRDLLNRVVKQILHLEGGKLTLYQGGYDRFEKTRGERLEQNEKLRSKQQAERARIQAFVDRFRYKASKAKQAQSRVRMLARMQPITQHREEGTIALAFPDPDPLAPPLISLDRVSVGYDGRPVLKKLSVRLDADDRVALLGANGNGKSTLLKLLAGRLHPLAGDVVKSGKLRVGYFAQHQADELDLEATSLRQLARRRPRDPEVQLRSHLCRFGFSQERADVRIGKLSGGEKARLLFAMMTAERPHILLLDEPSNHLDAVSRHALIEALNEFRGAVVIVSHDTYVLELTVDRFWLVENGGATHFEGDMQDYRALLLDRRNSTDKAGAACGGKPGESGDSKADRLSKKEQRRQVSERREALKPLKKRLVQAEHAVGRLESEKAELIEALADPQLYLGDLGRITETQKRLAQVQEQLDLTEEAWAGAQQAWDRAQSTVP